MTMQLATKTIQAIKDALNRDSCAQFRLNEKILLPKMDDAYRGSESKFRSHQGASGIGNECGRAIQLGWKWVVAPKFDERVLRLFNRGHLEEARFIAMLQCVEGIQLWFETEEGGQFKFSDHGHYGSALDGIAQGIPDVPPGAPCYTEFKTASDKKFNAFVKKGCKVENFTYYVQTQQCMKYYKLPYTLFMVVNKNTDELHAEIIEYNEQIANAYSERARDIIYANEALPRISNQPTFFACRFCDVKQVCFGKQLPEINCRTCTHWSPKTDGTFACARGHTEVVNHKTNCFTGCSDHVFDPTLLPQLSFLGGNHESNYSVLCTREGHEFKQGPDNVKSNELADYLARVK
jgi:hypothetical protein